VLVSVSVNDQRSGDPGPNIKGRGDEFVWSLVGSLVAGPLVWGLIGAGIDHLVGTERVFLPIGVVIGFITSVSVVYLRFGRNR
jgi:F0F1-type ATP synthase assembly protein I